MQIGILAEIMSALVRVLLYPSAVLSATLDKLSPFHTPSKKKVSITIKKDEYEISFVFPGVPGDTLLDRVNNIINAPLLKFIVSKDTNKKDKQQTSLVGLVAHGKSKKILAGQFMLFAAVLITLIIPSLLKASINISILVIQLVLVLMLLIYQGLINYRVKSGLYGTTESEAREIVTFILENADDSINGPHNGRIFPDPTVLTDLLVRDLEGLGFEGQ